jgi:hypothetical protein
MVGARKLCCRVEESMRVASLILTAVAMASALAHVFELPNKINLSRSEYLTVQKLYRGWALLAVVVFSAAVVTMVLALANWKEPRLFTGALISSLCVAASLFIFAFITYPVNQATANWTFSPSNWETLRRRWEYSHLASACLDVVALITLVVALMRAR